MRTRHRPQPQSHAARASAMLQGHDGRSQPAARGLLLEVRSVRNGREDRNRARGVLGSYSILHISRPLCLHGKLVASKRGPDQGAASPLTGLKSGVGLFAKGPQWLRRPSTRCRSSLRKWGIEGMILSSRTMPSTIAVPHPFGHGTNSFGRMLIAICSPGLLPRRSRTAWRRAFRRSAALRSTTLRRKSDEGASDATARTASSRRSSATAGSAIASILREMPSSNTRRTSPCCHPSSRLRCCCS